MRLSKGLVLFCAIMSILSFGSYAVSQQAGASKEGHLDDDGGITLMTPHAEGDPEIVMQLMKFKAGWDKDDVNAMVAIMDTDATLINPVGHFAKGQKEIAVVVSEEHATIFKGTTYMYGPKAIKIQTITPDLKIADIDATVTNIKAPDGAAAPDFAHHVTWVFIKKDGKWLASAARPYQYVKRPEAK